MRNSLPRKNITDEYSFPEEFLKNPAYYNIIVIPDDLTLDTLSYQLYGTPDYWDTLFYVNNMASVDDLPKSYEKIEAKIDIAIENLKRSCSSITNNFSIEKEYRKVLQNSYEVANERHRRFKYIKKEYINEFIRNIKHETASE